MAILKFKKTGKSIEVEDGNYIRKAAEELGVQFCCNIGICGSCIIDVIEGEDNLSEITQEEKNMDLDRKHRMACQCKIEDGEVTIDY